MLGETYIYEGEEGIVISENTGNQVIIFPNGSMILRTTDRKMRMIYEPKDEFLKGIILPEEDKFQEPEITEEEKAELKKRRDYTKRAIREANKATE
jgi:hypothetical protein